MTRTEALNTIREACIRANPEMKNFEFHTSAPPPKKTGHYRMRPIRLADILLAFDGTPQRDNLVLSTTGHFLPFDGPTPLKSAYDLTKDDIAQQSDETVQFIASLLANVNPSSPHTTPKPSSS